MAATIEIRIRSILWIATGAVLAVAATIIVTTAWHADAAPGDLDSTFVPTAGCRLIDTRSGPTNVGTRTTPLGEGDVHEVTVHGANGECTGALAIPTDAVAVAFNATAVDATARSNIRIYPANLTSPPNLSNINVTPGGPPTPNKVDVQLSSDGKVRIFNFRGSTDIILDIVGYYTKASLTEIDERLTALEAPTTSYKMIPAAALNPQGEFSEWSNNGVQLRATATTRNFFGDADVPHGATVTAVTLFAIDDVVGNGPGQRISLELLRADMPGSTSGAESMASISTDGAASNSRGFTGTTITNPVIDLENAAYYLSAEVPDDIDLSVNAIRIEYTMP